MKVGRAVKTAGARTDRRLSAAFGSWDGRTLVRMYRFRLGAVLATASVGLKGKHSCFRRLKPRPSSTREGGLTSLIRELGAAGLPCVAWAAVHQTVWSGVRIPAAAPGFRGSRFVQSCVSSRAQLFVVLCNLAGEARDACQVWWCQVRRRCYYGTTGLILWDVRNSHFERMQISYMP